ncbi:MAG TPA: hemolysin family protein [Bacteroidales bacterium]|nr:hemolysin family protein [Bacteroidales bacterium]
MGILIIGLLILLNGFFSLSEIALVSSKRAKLEQLRIDGKKGAKSALKLLENSENFLSAVQVGITIISIVTGVYGGINIADDIAPLFRQVGFLESSANEIALIVTILVITYFSIVFGELVPKTIALSNPEKVALRISPVIYYFSKLFYPFVKLLSDSTNLFDRMIGIKKHTEQITESELRQMIKIASNEGVIGKEQNLIHEKIFYFADKKAKHIMTHRIDVEWIDITDPDEIIKSVMVKTKYSKIVVCNGGLDNFIGILYVKDYLLALNSGNPLKISELLVAPLIVPENVEARRVIKLFRQKQIHFCVVVNEYGSFEGIITLHNIMENIIGDIPEEGEPYEPDIFIREDKSALVSGDAPVEILEEIIEGFTIDFEKTDYSTVAGFVISNINKIPQIGDKFDYSGYQIEIVDIDGNRVDKILVRKKE